MCICPSSRLPMLPSGPGLLGCLRVQKALVVAHVASQDGWYRLHILRILAAEGCPSNLAYEQFLVLGKLLERRVPESVACCVHASRPSVADSLAVRGDVAFEHRSFAASARQQSTPELIVRVPGQARQHLGLRCQLAFAGPWHGTWREGPPEKYARHVTCRCLVRDFKV